MSKMLVVDDDSQLLDLIGKLLSPAEFDVVLCDSPRATLSQVAVDTDIDIAVLNLWLGLNCVFDLYDKILARLPDLPVVSVSDGSGSIPMETTSAIAEIKGAETFLFRPFKGEDLVSAVQNALS